MKATYQGVMPIDEFFQAFFQDREFFREHGITHIRSASLFFTPCDERGRPVRIADRHGIIVEGFRSAGAYPSLADLYDETGTLEPRTVTRETKNVGKGRGAGKNAPKPG